MLATVADIKSRLGVASADTTLDAILADVLADASGAMEGPTGVGRALQLASRTWYFDVEPRTWTLYLPVFPVVSITSVKEAFYGAHSATAAMTEDNGWWANYERGLLNRTAFWLPGRQVVEVVYTAGYLPAETAAWVSGTAYAAGAVVTVSGVAYVCILAVTGTTGPATDTTHWTALTRAAAVPADLRRACARQAVHDYATRLAPGAQSVGGGGGNVGLADSAALLPEVAEVCRLYRRVA